MSSRAAGAARAAAGITALALNVILWQEACSSPAETPAEPPCDCCYAGRCIALLGCVRDEQCPAGLRCLSPSSSEAQAIPPGFEACAATVDGGRCQIQHSGSEYSDLELYTLERTLIQGFRVPEMGFERADAGAPAASFTVTPPPEATLLSCTVFACVPDVGAPPDLVSITAPPSVHDPSSPQPTTILDFDKCALYTVTLPATVGTFSLVDFVVPKRASDTCSWQPLKITGPKRPVVTDLVAGCLAYGESGIVAASRLRVLTAGDLHDTNFAVTATCAASMYGHVSYTEGMSCTLDAGLDRFGTCVDGGCTPRCVSNADCLLGFSCDRPEDAGTFLGVCLPEGGA